jgi:hypothetical protein
MLDINGEDLREMSFKNQSLNIAQHNKSKIYPNPFKEQFTIESEQLIKTIHIFDLNGKEVYSNSMNDYNQSFAPILLKGIYQLKLIFENETIENQKLLVY